MNKQRVNEIILSPESLKYNSDLGVVNELIQSFPYFSTPYIMLSKMLHDENSIYFDKNLKLSAAYIGDREILYNYIKSREKSVAEIQYVAESSPSVSEPQPIPERISIPEIEENQPESTNEVTVLQPVLGHKEPETIAPSLNAEIEPEKEKLQRGSTFDLFQYPVSDYFGQYYKKNKKPIDPEIPIPQASPDTLSGKKSFSDWLDAIESSAQNPARNTIHIKKISETEATPETNDLITKFIQTEPKIRPQQSKMYKPEDMAKLSVVEDHNIATETLANIYLKQGLKTRALEIFQQLILKYPEKSGYFAERISEIQSEGTL
jgi:hypothetical protein